MATTVNHAVESFTDRFGRAPEILVRAPGRVNLIGGHTDYNGGHVLPVAIERCTFLAAARRSDRLVDVVSEGFGETTFDLGDLRHDGPTWAEYLKGVAWALGPPLVGWDGYLTSDIPLGAGLSSSAALEMATALVLTVLADRPWQPVAAAQAGQRAENEWVGLRSGIMDQLTVATSKAGHAQLIDCKTFERRYVPVPDRVTVVVLDTGTRRRLADSSYNRRRDECARAARAFGVPSLRDLTAEDLSRPPSGLDPVAYARTRHVVTENARTLEAADALGAGDLERLGELINASHESLRDDFEVSSPALDTIVDAARHSPGCFGARMTGAGFAGCAVAIVERDHLDDFLTEAADRYRSALGVEPTLYPSRPTDGVSTDSW